MCARQGVQQPATPHPYCSPGGYHLILPIGGQPLPMGKYQQVVQGLQQCFNGSHDVGGPNVSNWPTRGPRLARVQPPCSKRPNQQKIIKDLPEEEEGKKEKKKEMVSLRLF